VDRDDCIAAFATGQVHAKQLLERYSEAARYDLNPEKVMRNFEIKAKKREGQTAPGISTKLLSEHPLLPKAKRACFEKAQWRAFE